MKAPLVVDIKRNSLDDGPGIRTVVFFKGCPLRCDWCQNPEALSPTAQLQLDPEHCVRCGACREACPEGVARPAGDVELAGDCRRCGACGQVCPSTARRVVGEELDGEELARRALRDEPFFRSSGGGVTLSGGEPTLFLSFVGELAQRLRQRDVHVLLETCGHFAWEPFARHLLPHLSAIYVDIKLVDPRAHRRHTGRGNEPILANLRRLAELREVEVLPRVPLVPDITTEMANLRAIAQLLGELRFSRVALLAYNPLWLSKRRSLGLELTYDCERWMSDDEVARCRQPFVEAGLEVR